MTLAGPFVRVHGLELCSTEAEDGRTSEAPEADRSDDSWGPHRTRRAAGNAERPNDSGLDYA